MNGKLYVQKKMPDGTLLAGWLCCRSPEGDWRFSPLGPGKDTLTSSLEDAMVFDLNNKVNKINEYVEDGWVCCTASNITLCNRSTAMDIA